jgi:formamidase
MNAGNCTIFGKVATPPASQTSDICQLGHRGYTAVAGGSIDCPYTFIEDLAKSTYRLPWEDKVLVTNGRAYGLEPRSPESL